MMPHILPITIRDSRRPQEDERAMSMFSFLATCLLFTGFLVVLFSVKNVWDLKIENWRLVKENAALKKTVKDNVPAEKFKQYIPSEADINWLARELADQIYERKKEFDQEKKKEAKTIFEIYDEEEMKKLEE